MKEKNEAQCERVRLQKYISACGVMSRRAAEQRITEGRVSVNGETASLGCNIMPGCDVVEIDGVRIKPIEKYLTVMLNKPRGYVTTLSDELGRKTVAELVESYGVRLNPVGRLDRDSEGLLLMTNDGELLNHLTHPRYSLPKLYRVTVGSAATPEQIARLRAPMTIDGYRLQRVGLKIVRAEESRTVFEMTLHEGRNRQMRRMCETVGLEVVRLRRVAIGKLRIGSLRPGESKPLTDEQLAYLCEHTGMTAEG